MQQYSKDVLVSSQNATAAMVAILYSPTFNDISAKLIVGLGGIGMPLLSVSANQREIVNSIASRWHLDHRLYLDDCERLAVTPYAMQEFKMLNCSRSYQDSRNKPSFWKRHPVVDSIKEDMFEFATRYNSVGSRKVITDGSADPKKLIEALGVKMGFSLFQGELKGKTKGGLEFAVTYESHNTGEGRMSLISDSEIPVLLLDRKTRRYQGRSSLRSIANALIDRTTQTY